MRSIVTAFLLVLAPTSAFAATATLPPKAPVHALRPPVISTIAQMRQMKFPYQPINVTALNQSANASSPSTGAQSVPAQPTASDYQTGSGIVLGPGHWAHSWLAGLNLYYVWINPSAPGQLNSPDGCVDLIMEPSQVSQKYLIGFANYGELPVGKHTYMMTLNATSHCQSLANALEIQVENQTFTASQIVVNADTARILFTFDPAYGTPPSRDPAYGSIQVRLCYKNTATLNAQTDLTFYSLQFAQLD